jgi:fibronectin-binding autotransporter adhesin
MTSMIRLALLLAFLTVAFASPGHAQTWPNQCPAGTTPSAIGCQPEAAAPLATDLLPCWQIAQPLPHTRSCQVQQLLGSTTPAVTALFSSPPPLGNVAPNTGAFTTLSANNATVSGTFGVTGAATLGGTLGVTGSTTLGGTLAVTGASTLTGPITTPSVITINVAQNATAISTPGNGNFGWLSAFASGGATETWGTGVNNGPGVNFIFASGNVTGVADALTRPTAYVLNSTDSVDASATTNGFFGLNSQTNIGAGSKGGQTAMIAQLTQTGAIADTGSFYVALSAWAGSNFPVTAAGNMIAFNPQAILTSGATGYGLLEAVEGSVSSSTPLVTRGGVMMFSGSTTAGSNDDYAFGLASASGAVGWSTGFILGRTNTPFGMTSTGSVVGVNVQTNGIQPVNQTVAYGWKLPTVNFTAAAWWTPGLFIGGTGRIFAGTMQIVPVSSGAVLDVSNYVGSSPVISVGGLAYQVGDFLYDTNGGILVVDTVGGTGAILTLHYLTSGGQTTSPYSYGVTGPATMALSGGHGNQAAVVGVTWTQKTMMTLQSSGGPLLIGGPVTLVSQPLTVGSIDNGTTGLVLVQSLSKLAFFGNTPVVEPVPSGACAGNTGCQALRDALASLGLIVGGGISN